MDNQFYFYAVCLASFRADITHGTWINARLPVEEMRQRIDEMLATSSFEHATKWRIHRYDIPYELDFLHDETPLEALHNIALFLESEGDKGAKVLDYFDGDIESALEALEHYLGHFNTPENFMRQHFLKRYKLSSLAQKNVDFNGLWYQLHYAGYYFELKSNQDDGVYIFSNDIGEGI